MPLNNGSRCKGRSSPEMLPLRPWHSDRLRHVPLSPLVPVHSELGKVTTWNKLKIQGVVTSLLHHVISRITIKIRIKSIYLKNLSVLVSFWMLSLFSFGNTGTFGKTVWRPEERIIIVIEISCFLFRILNSTEPISFSPGEVYNHVTDLLCLVIIRTFTCNLQNPTADLSKMPLNCAATLHNTNYNPLRQRVKFFNN